MVCYHAEAKADADTPPHLGINIPINSDFNGPVIYP